MRAPSRREALVTLGAASMAGLAACTAKSAPSADSTRTTTSAAATTSSAAPTPTVTRTVTPTPTPTPLGKPVQVSSLLGDGQTYGVGMPIIISFSVDPTSKVAFQKAAVVTVNGKPAAGAWYWMKRLSDEGLEAHYRLQQPFWPAYSKIHVGLPLKTLSAGKGLSFANDLTLDYSIGAQRISRVDAAALTMSIYTNGKLTRSVPVSLGKSSTPTFEGYKVVMGKTNPQRMIGPGYNELVAWSVRITQSGEFIHAAPWNSQIGQVSTSNGCTNLSTADAQWFYGFAQVGDVIQYPNASGGVMPSWDGYGDWNLSWPTWLAGGAL